MSSSIHKDPYATATLGLINIRKGNIERGESLYEEAIHLALGKSDKIRIRQKLNFELAKICFEGNPSKAQRYLQKVTEQTLGSPELVIQATALKNRLAQH